MKYKSIYLIFNYYLLLQWKNKISLLIKHEYPCIYFFNFGKVKDLKKIINLDNYNDNVISFGIDISIKIAESITNFIKIFNNNSFNINYSYIFYDYTKFAEYEINSLMNLFNIKNYFNNLIIIINDVLYNIFLNSYKNISEKYSYIANDLLKKIDQLNNEKKTNEDKYKLELDNKKLQFDLLNKENEIKNMKIIELNNKMLELEKKNNDLQNEINKKNNLICELEKENNDLLNKNLF